MRRRTAAVVLLLVLAGACGDDPGGDTSAAGDGRETPSATPSPTPTLDLPDRYVAAVGGDVVVVDGGTEQRLADYDLPTPSSSEPESVGNYVSALEASADASTVYVDVCCEPAIGNLHRIRVGSPAEQQFAYAMAPALSPDGSRLAAAAAQSVVLLDPATGDETARLDPPPAEHPTLLSLAWSPDGRTLAVAMAAPGDLRTTPSYVRLLDVATDRSLAAGRVFSPPPGESLLAPAFRADGRLVVARQPVDGPDSGPATGLVLDPATGAEVAQLPLDSRVVAQDYDAAGEFLLTTYADGHLGWQGSGRAGTLRDGDVSAAAW